MIFRDARAHNLTGSGHVWIVTEQALHANNTPPGILGLELNYSQRENEHIRVSMPQYADSPCEFMTNVFHRIVFTYSHQQLKK